jgi:translation initiation factor 5
MATVNIRRDVTDPFYRYKMERLQSKIEGKGNGIKTVIVNLTSVANSLARPPSHVIKYFGFELGAQTNTSPNDDRWIINGAHDANKLQDYLDGFISKFVLCKKVDPRLKLSAFIVKNEPKKGKKDKSTKKAERRARKEAEARGEEVNGGSPGDSAEDEENGELEIEAGSDDELTKQIQEGAEDIQEAKEVEWHIDTSEAAIKARAQDLPEDLKRALVIEGEEDAEASEYDVFGKWIIDTAKEKGGVDKVDSVELYLKAKELGIETKHRTLTVIPQTLFSDKIVKQIEGRAPMLQKLITSEKHEKAFLGGIERFVGNDKPELIPQVSAICIQIYNNDLVSEEVFKPWCQKASKKYVDLKVSKTVRKSAEKFYEWLCQEDSDEEEEESDEE